jgi:hypothetical protein
MTLSFTGQLKPVNRGRRQCLLHLISFCAGHSVAFSFSLKLAVDLLVAFCIFACGVLGVHLLRLIFG